jgi:hypothetical protein
MLQKPITESPETGMTGRFRVHDAGSDGLAEADRE